MGDAVTDWRETLTSPAFLAAIEAPVRLISARAELVDSAGEPVPLRVGESGPVWDLPLASASVEFRGESAEQYSGRLTFTDPTLIPTSPTHALDPRAARMVRLWWQVQTTPARRAVTSCAFLQDAVDETDATVYTFAAQNLGPDFPGRTIVVAGTGRKSAPFGFGGVTVGGVPVTIDTTAAVDSEFCTFIGHVSAPGAVADVVVTWTGATMLRCGIAMWAIRGTPVATSSVLATIGNPVRLDSTLPGAGAFTIGYATAWPAPEATWTGVTERFDRLVGTTYWGHTGADGTSVPAVQLPNGAPVSALLSVAYAAVDVPATWLEVPVMTGIPEDPDTTDDGTTTTSMTLRDPIATIRGGHGGTPLLVSGLTISAALRAIFDRVAPTLRVTIEESDIVLPTDYALGGRSPMEDVRELAGIGYMNGGARTSRDGSIRVGSRPEPAVGLDWQEGPTCAVSEMGRSVTTSRMGNQQTVIYSGSDETLVGLYYTAEDDDPTSPTWVGGPWGVHPLPDIESDAVTTTAACENLARMHLGKGLHPVEEIDVVIPQRPDLTYRQPVRLARAQLGVGDTYHVSSWRLDLPANGEAPAPMPVGMMERTAE